MPYFIQSSGRNGKKIMKLKRFWPNANGLKLYNFSELAPYLPRNNILQEL